MVERWDEPKPLALVRAAGEIGRLRWEGEAWAGAAKIAWQRNVPLSTYFSAGTPRLQVCLTESLPRTKARS